jgi:hypothetical protein
MAALAFFAPQSVSIAEPPVSDEADPTIFGRPVISEIQTRGADT